MSSTNNSQSSYHQNIQKINEEIANYGESHFKPSVESVEIDDSCIYSIVYSKKIVKHNNCNLNSSGIIISKFTKMNLVDESEIFKSDDIDKKQYIKINNYDGIDCISNNNIYDDTIYPKNIYSNYSIILKHTVIENLLNTISCFCSKYYEFLYQTNISESIQNKTESKNLLYIYAIFKYLKNEIGSGAELKYIPLSNKNIKILHIFLEEKYGNYIYDFDTTLYTTLGNYKNNSISCVELADSYKCANIVDIIDIEKLVEYSNANYGATYYNYNSYGFKIQFLTTIYRNIVFTENPIENSTTKALTYLTAGAYHFKGNIFRNINFNNTFFVFNNSDYVTSIQIRKINKLITFLNLGNNKILKFLKFKVNIENLDGMLLANINIYLDYDKYYEFTHGKIKINYTVFEILFQTKNIKKNHLHGTEISNKLMYDNFDKLANNINLSEEYYSNEKVNIKYNKTLSELTLEPFDYQKKNIIWMDNLENKIFQNKSKINMLKDAEYNLFLMNKKWYTLKKSNLDNSIDNSNRYDISYSLSDYELFSKNNKYCLSLQGGIIADEVGLGKTFSTISHLINQIYRDKMLKTNEEHINYNYDCNNLIIVPARLITQWKLEFKKYVKPALLKAINMKVCSVVKDITKHKYEDFVKSDIVIISQNLLMNDNYIKKYLLDTETQTQTQPQTQPNTSTENSNNSTQNKKNDEKKIDLFKMKWNRVIIDEAHEFLCSPIDIRSNYIDIFKNEIMFEKEICSGNLYKRKNFPAKLGELVIKLYKMKINYKWLLTATPFIHPILNYNSYLNFLSSSQEPLNFIYNREFDTFDIFCKKRIRRNTKKSIASEIDIPIISEEIKYIKQTSTERNIYLDYERQNKIDKLFMLCTHILVSDNDNSIFGTDKLITMNDINNVMSKKYKTELTNVTTQCKKYQTKLESTTNKLIIFNGILDYLSNKYNFDSTDSTGYINDNIKNCLSQVLTRSRIDSSNKLKLLSYHLNYNIEKFIIELFNYIQIFQNLEDSEAYYKEISDFCDNFSTINFDSINSIIKITDEETKKNIKYYIVKLLISKVIIDSENKNKKYYENKVKELENSKIRCNNQIKLFERTSNFVSESIKDPCAICFSDFEETFCMLKCRHILCEFCVSQIFKSNHQANCPFCRTPNLKTDIRKVKIETEEEIKKREEEEQRKEEEKKKMDKDKSDLVKNIEKYGSKLANLITHLNKLFENPENRVIIFSQYDKMLKMVGSVLSDFSIKHIYMKGNVRVLNKNIERFKTDNSYRVIMLSSETSASGNNLTEANNIIFVDVLNADKQKTMDIEAQAIGRAVRLGQKKPVKITRFIMKDTIEETTHKKNYYSLVDNS